MTRVAKLLFSALILSIFPGAVMQAATINAVSCSFANVSNAVNAAAEGDTVVIPACQAGVSWTTPLTVTKGITIQGQGIGKTVLIDDVPKGNSSCGSSNPMIRFSVDSPSTFRLTGLTILGSATDPFICQPGHVVLSGSSKAFRVDHVRFDNQQTVGIRTFGDLWGVIDHCEFQGNHKQGVIVDHEGWAGQSNGDGSWAAPTNFGSQEFIFIEDCTFTDANAVGAGAIDVFGGGRVVFRHNTAAFLASHGTESTRRKRGIRAFEVYDNTFTAVQNPQFTAIFVRGGTGVVHDNTFLSDASGNKYTRIVILENDRSKDAFTPWATCDGTSSFDNNDGVAYVSGTHNGPDGVSNTLTDTTKDFTKACSGGSCAGNGFSIRNVTKGWGSQISSVTATTVSNSGSAFGQNRSWNTGDQYQILRAYPCIDQVGRGQGDLLTGSTPTPAVWPNQAQEPVYQWNNTLNGVGNPVMGSNSVQIRVNRDYFDNQAKPGYTPFPYPHPLTLGTGGVVDPPTNLRKVAP